MTTAIAARNRAIKKTLEHAFGKGKVRVQGGRGTSWGWAEVQIAYSPLDWQQGRELHAQCIALIKAAGIELFHYYGDMDNDARPEISINFDRCRYRDTFAGKDGRRYGRQEDNEPWQDAYL